MDSSKGICGRGLRSEWVVPIARSSSDDDPGSPSGERRGLLGSPEPQDLDMIRADTGHARCLDNRDSAATTTVQGVCCAGIGSTCVGLGMLIGGALRGDVHLQVTGAWVMGAGLLTIVGAMTTVYACSRC